MITRCMAILKRRLLENCSRVDGLAAANFKPLDLHPSATPLQARSHGTYRIPGRGYRSAIAGLMDAGTGLALLHKAPLNFPSADASPPRSHTRQFVRLAAVAHPIAVKLGDGRWASSGPGSYPPAPADRLLGNHGVRLWTTPSRHGRYPPAVAGQPGDPR
jgi:hypothetical protein